MQSELCDWPQGIEYVKDMEEMRDYVDKQMRLAEKEVKLVCAHCRMRAYAYILDQGCMHTSGCVPPYAYILDQGCTVVGNSAVGRPRWHRSSLITNT